MPLFLAWEDGADVLVAALVVLHMFKKPPTGIVCMIFIGIMIYEQKIRGYLSLKH